MNVINVTSNIYNFKGKFRRKLASGLENNRVIFIQTETYLYGAKVTYNFFQ